ncbi:MAG: glutamine--fructose-6-phosphate transaminase (isomerizing) [Candidatus Margulisbacteria bacterium]|nr:glutamine--fructose-6-phosphate transaminase (isomerizing) [Candidatus Margulisiibacteriota bacterium]MBU1021226.1 glutamine--fructose-6-phosphate transaminase (isomerizing) [Candidatus Margulisiibacteriota bacterium]MBU1729832.1 glutamine--fructose-6-phosphate transaminase (isomerizing) [Candidatus Margulisiibacteriota bacterium]MBU1955333.1 glutamine--fructose-6-phosphate transaminase (isomerizing) [Candidatus Margulisiibacteriota bacterium]
MCGIFGYIGKSEAVPFIVEGLKKLEYRGYDSAGVATYEHGRIFVSKCEGKIAELEELLTDKPIGGEMGIGHTRWATHGSPSDVNSHPHTSCDGKIALVHNGIIENYLELRRKLSEEGHKFKSTTDTEVIVHLVEKYYKGDLEKAMRQALQEVTGSYAIAAICEQEPGKIVCARKGSPLIVGLSDNEAFISSDIPAIIKYTSKVIYLEDEEVATIQRKKIQISTLDGKPVKRKPTLISWDPESAEKGGYAHFMLKEIHEQPGAIRKTIAHRVNVDSAKVHFDELNLEPKEIRHFNRIIFTACGTSWHAALVGEYLMERYAKIPVEVEYAAEFRYREPIVDDKTLLIAVSQSGETADTLGAVWEAKARGAKVISICNVVGSSLARESHGVIYTDAGPEIGVASTKAFTTQLAVIYLLTVLFGQVRKTLPQAKAIQMINNLMEIPDKMERVLAKEADVEKLSEKFYNSTNALYLGRGKGFPVALEGALKLKEVSYIHAEGYPAAEMKHGPIALIDKNMPVVVLAMHGRRYDKILGNIEEVKARGGIVIAIASEGDQMVKEKADEIIYIPASTEAVSPMLAVVPLQLFAYYIAVKRGCHVDQPRNLAKSVTVE